jgi:hypothetical protein
MLLPLCQPRTIIRDTEAAGLLAWRLMTTAAACIATTQAAMTTTARDKAEPNAWRSVRVLLISAIVCTIAPSLKESVLIEPWPYSYTLADGNQPSDGYFFLFLMFFCVGWKT